MRPDGYQGGGEEEARVSSETLAFAEEIFCLITCPPRPQKQIVVCGHVFVGTKKKKKKKE